MNKILVTYALLCTLVYHHAQADTLSGRVVRVIDGDTLIVLDTSKTQQKIRLQGIDVPERRQAFGTKSKEHLSALVAGQVVVVEYHDRDRYQRILGKVLLYGEDINLEQVSSGMAWHYKKYQSEQSTADRIRHSGAELEARREKLGLWHDPNPVPPWDYRQAERDQRKSMEPFVGRSTVWK